eukprot:1912186-Pyramimonas_sp.AAC.1
MPRRSQASGLPGMPGSPGMRFCCCCCCFCCCSGVFSAIPLVPLSSAAAFRARTPSVPPLAVVAPSSFESVSTSPSPTSTLRPAEWLRSTAAANPALRPPCRGV